jgi:arsenate reductase
MNILVLCTGNSARSIMLESLFTGVKRSGDRLFSRVFAQWHGSSTIAFLLDSLGFDTDIFRSKNWDEFATTDAPHMNLVITACGSAAGEPCPIWPGTLLRAHWRVEDPISTDQADWEVAFLTVSPQHNLRIPIVWNIW